MKPIWEIFKRVVQEYIKDPYLIQNETYNESAGAVKHMHIEPVVKGAVGADDLIPFGSYVKVIGTTYTLRLLGKNYDANRIYRINQLAVESGRVYISTQDHVTGTFDATKWRDVAASSIGPVTIAAGAVVCSGRYHNNVGAAGWLVEDDSEIKIGS
jgi:hypothetical protein